MFSSRFLFIFLLLLILVDIDIVFCLFACLPPLLYVSFIWIFRLSPICFYRFSLLTQSKPPPPSPPSSHSHLPKPSNGKFAIQHIDFNICVSCSFKQALHIKWRDGARRGMNLDDDENKINAQIFLACLSFICFLTSYICKKYCIHKIKWILHKLGTHVSCLCIMWTALQESSPKNKIKCCLHTLMTGTE